MKTKTGTSLLHWLVRQAKRRLPAVVLLTVINAVVALSFIRLALLSQQLIDTAAELMTAAPVDTVWDYFRMPALYLPALELMGIILLQVVLNVIGSNLHVRAAGKLEMGLRQSLFSTLMKKEYSELRGFHSGELLNRLTSDVSIVVSGVIGIVPAAVSMLAKLIGGLAVLTMISPWFTLVLVVLGGVVVAGSRVYGIYVKRFHKRCQETEGETRAFLQESMENFLTVKAFFNEKRMSIRLKQYQKKNYKQKIARNTVNNIGNTGVYLVLTGAYYVALLWGVVCLIAGTLTFGSLAALLQIFEQLKAPLRHASGILPQYYSMMASAERLQELERLADEQYEPLPASADTLFASFSALHMKGVTFHYDDDTPVLSNVTVSLKRGEVVALIGESGIGKSTLMKLLLSIHSPNSGDLSLQCGTVTVPISCAARLFFSYVPQGNTMLAGTVRENVTFFREDITDDAIYTALRLACLDEFVEALPKGLDTLIGEHGLGISEGQAQRFAIARALLMEAPILLLDECTSALDASTEKQVLENIRSMTDKTVLMISHKNTAVQGNDRVLRLEHGLLQEV